MYDRTSSQKCVNEARKQLFTQKGRSIDGLPPAHWAHEEDCIPGWSLLVIAGHCWSLLVIAGHCWSLLGTDDDCCSQVNGVGPRRLGKSGKCVGQLYLKQHKSVENLFVVAVKKDAEDAASAASFCPATLFM